MERNIFLSKVIFSLNVAWFWLGIWVPYYLLFTNYAGIGLIETVVVVSAFALELPTGAMTDLIGKKKTLLLVFLLYVAGDLVMAEVHHFWHLLVAVLLLGVGTSLFSGTKDAFLYDTLLSLKKEKDYPTLLANIQKIGLIVMAFASAVGGWMYMLNPAMPFLAVAIVHGICGIITLFLVEPVIDSEKFSFKQYVLQMKYGLKELFTSAQDQKWLWKIIIISCLAKFLIEGMDPALGLYFGLSGTQLGYLYAIVPLVSAVGAYWYEKQSDRKQNGFWWRLIVVTFFLTTLFSPILGIVVGTLALLLRNIFYPILETMASNVVNESVESKYRTTTLSAFSMIRSLPYVLGAALLGRFVDLTNAGIVVAGFSACFLAIYFFFFHKRFQHFRNFD